MPLRSLAALALAASLSLAAAGGDKEGVEGTWLPSSAALGGLGRRDEAAAELRQASDLFGKLIESSPGVPGYQVSQMRVRANLGEVLRADGHRQEAMREFQAALALGVALTAAHPGVPDYRDKLAFTRESLGGLLGEMGRREEALGEYRLADELRTRLVQAHPDRPDFLVYLAGNQVVQSLHLKEMGRPVEALAWAEKAIALLRSAHGRGVRHRKSSHFASQAHEARAGLLARMGRHREAAADLDEGIRLVEDPAARLRFRRLRADALARAGDYLQSVDEVRQVSEMPTKVGVVAYHLACIQALNAASAGRDITRPLPGREKFAEKFARQAIALLEQAGRAGHFAAPNFLRHLEQTADPAVLRDRADFREFLRTLPGGAPYDKP